MANSAVSFNTEIRKLKPAHRCALGDILNVSDSWKKLMAIIPRNDTNTMRFNSEHVSIVEQTARKYRHNAAEILLDEWSTMGRERPTLQVLLDLLIKAQLFRAADYVASDILNVDLPQRPEYGPAAVIDISDETLAKLINKQAKLENTEYSKFSTNECSNAAITQNVKVDTEEENESQNAQNNKESSVDCKFQEISSQELPAFVNNFEDDKNKNNELNSSELPAFLNQSSFFLQESVTSSGNSDSQ